MSRRRTFIKSLGSLSVIGATGNANAKEDNEKQSGQTRYEKSRLNEKLHRNISKAFQSGGSDSVSEILEKERISYNQVTTVPDIGTSVEENPKFTKEDKYSESDAELHVLTIEGSEPNLVHVFVQEKLGDTKLSSGSAQYVNDVIGMGFDGEQWTIVGEPYVQAYDPHDATFHSGSYPADNGLAGEVDIQHDGFPWLIPDGEYWVELYTELKYTGDTVTPILGYYEHTEAFDGTGIIEAINVGASVIDVELGGDATTLWSMGEFNDPDGVI